MDLTDFGSIAIVGVIASIVIQAIKKVAGTSNLGNKVLTVAISVIFGAGYYLLKDTSIWTSIVGVLTVSSTVYAFFINNPQR